MSDIKLCGELTCTQCYACQIACPKNCISFDESDNGFSFPHIDYQKCIGCGKCIRSCHELSSSTSANVPIKVYASWSRLKEERRNSSSGGVFSVIARTILSKGGVVYGATMNPDLDVIHISVHTNEELYRLRGSKYVQSYLGETFKLVRNDLLKGKSVLFSGTPCQVAALNTFLNQKYDNLITCDFICHGVPPQKSFDAFIKKINLPSNCTNVGFRFTEGWGFRMSYKLSGTNRLNVIWPRDAYYMRAYAKGLMFGEACYNCRYAQIERVSDITLGDFWGIGKEAPFKYSKRNGVSMLLVNTTKGQALVDSSIDLFCEERNIDEAIKGNYNLTKQSLRPPERQNYYKDSIELSVKDLTKKYNIEPSYRDYLRIIKQFIVTKI